MREKKKDRRVLYTKTLLRESLLELMKEKPISKITPTELCRRANVNRNTFYSHYDNPETLLSNIESELFEQIRASLEQSWDDASVKNFLTEICEAIYKNGDLCTVLFSDYGNKDFLRRIAYLVHDKCITEWKGMGIKADDETFEYIFTFTINGSVAVIQRWTQEGMRHAPQEVALFIEKISYSSLRVFIDK